MGPAPGRRPRSHAATGSFAPRIRPERFANSLSGAARFAATIGRSTGRPHVRRDCSRVSLRPAKRCSRVRYRLPSTRQRVTASPSLSRPTTWLLSEGEGQAVLLVLLLGDRPAVAGAVSLRSTSIMESRAPRSEQGPRSRVPSAFM